MPSTASTPIRRTTTGTGQRLELADVLHLVQDRDEELLNLLDEHLVLTTGLIDEALFGALRSCQRRLAQLKELGLLASWSPPRQRERGGSGQTRWVLGRLGLDFHAARRDQRMTAPLKAKVYVALLARRPSLNHLLGVNTRFCALLGQGRRHRDRWLEVWWDERSAARNFSWVHPDGVGLWHEHDREVAFFVEWDTGTEDLGRLVGKLAGYEQAAHHGPRYPVLFCLHSPERERNLHRALAARRDPFPIATAVHPLPDPAGAVWAIVGDATGARRRLIDLPHDHGPDNRFHHPRG
jgi:hypothetical protein